MISIFLKRELRKRWMRFCSFFYLVRLISICRKPASICRNQLAICNFIVLFAECSLLFAAYFVLFAESPVLFANLLCVPFPFSMQFFFLQNPVCYLQLTSFYLQNPRFYLQKLLCVPFPVLMQFVYLQNPASYLYFTCSICRFSGPICKFPLSFCSVHIPNPRPHKKRPVNPGGPLTFIPL